MCTRFYVAGDLFTPLIERAKHTSLTYQFLSVLGKSTFMSGEIHPTDVAAVLAPNKDGKMAVFPMMWGFTVPDSDAPIVNCRLETADRKNLWKDSWYRRRCVIPAAWYYEWEHFRAPDGKLKTGSKYIVQPKDAEITWLAGLYRFEKHKGIEVPVFAVLTRASSPELHKLHDRMPLILGKEIIAEWIRPDGVPAKAAETALTEMVAEKYGGEPSCGHISVLI